MTKGLLINASRCIACRACEVACSLSHEGEIDPSKSLIGMQLFNEAYFYYPMVCAQCEIPYCALNCPTRALEKNPETGQVDFIADKCINCNLCTVTCPFGAVTVRDGLAHKCDLCDGDPWCVKFCEVGAISYGELPEPADHLRALPYLRFTDEVVPLTPVTGDAPTA
jgi:carbon-monoxide dehydrogenase iron sulfur subunit